MKIAMFTDAYFPRINGVAVSVHSYAHELSRLGHHVCVVCLEYTEEQQKSTFFDEKTGDESLPFKIIRIPSTSLGKVSKEDRMVKLYKWNFVKKAMDEFKPDIIHINSEWTVGYFGAIYSRHRHIPFVFTFHTLWEDYLVNYVTFLPEKSLKKIGIEVVRFYLKRASKIITPTKNIQEVVSKYGINRESTILPTGIPDSKTQICDDDHERMVERIYKRLPQIRDKKIMLFVGRVVREKNIPFLFDVLEKVRKTVSNAVLLIVGGGPHLDELREIVSKRNLDDCVFFTGYIDGDILINFYKMACVFTFPSKTETQGLVTIEAMISGLPVVAIGQMGTIDVMQGDNGGFMVKDDTMEFAEKTMSLMTDSKLWKQKSLEAQLWGSKWKISSLTPKLIECYVEAIKNGPYKRWSFHKNKEN